MEHLLLPGRLEVREDPGDGSATITGLAVPWDTPVSLGSHTETMSRGAADPLDVVGVPLLWQHDHAEPLGSVSAARSGDDGLTIEARIEPTARGRDAATLLRAGAIRGLSIGFEPLEQAWDGPAVTRSKVRIHEISIATLPAYQQARVTEVRGEPMDTTTVAAPPEVVPEQRTAAQPDRSWEELRDRLDRVEARSLVTHAAPVRLDVRATLIRQLEDAVAHRQVRALADVLSSGNAGLLPPSWAGQVLGYLDATRYLIPRTGTVAFPTTGSTITFPRITQNTLVAARGTEKTGIPTRALTSTTSPYTATWYAGGDDIALELIEQSSPEVMAVVVQNLLQQYAAVTDQAVTLAAETAATATGAVLDFTTYKTFVTQVITTSEVIRGITGQPGDRLSLTAASWGKLVSLADSTGRRILSDTGGTNADGSVNLVTPFVDVGGILCYFNPRAAEDMQYNETALRVAEKPPLQLSSTNVTLMGQDVGILGAVIVLPLYPTGMRVYSLTLREGNGGGGKR